MQGNFSRNDYHPTRAAANWPSLTRASSELIRVWGRYPSMDQFNALLGRVMMDYNEQIMRVPRLERPSNMDVVVSHAEMMTRVGTLRAHGMHVYSIEPDVVSMVRKTTLHGVRIGDLKPLFPYLYIGIEGGTDIRFTVPGQDEIWLMDGAYVDMRGMADAGELSMSVILTARKSGNDTGPEFALRWRLSREPHYTLDLSGAPERTFEEILGHAIESGDIALEADPDKVDRLHSNVVEMQPEFAAMGKELRAPEVTGHERQAEFTSVNLGAAREGLALILGILCALSGDAGALEEGETGPADVPEEVIRELQEARTPKQRRKPLAILRNMGFDMVKRITLGEAARSVRASMRSGENAGPRAAHWRAGHFRRQKHGAGLQLTKLIWIMPQLIGAKGDEEIGGRLYLVRKGRERG